MSWFDAAGLANIAKSALKEAQRTIDKALDIKDDGVNEARTVVDINNDDVFGNCTEEQKENVVNKKEPADNTQNTIWGSFTGSFFDNPKGYSRSISLEGLDDSVDINNQHFTHSKLVVEPVDESNNVVEEISGNADLSCVDGPNSVNKIVTDKIEATSLCEDRDIGNEGCQNSSYSIEDENQFDLPFTNLSGNKITMLESGLEQNASKVDPIFLNPDASPVNISSNSDYKDSSEEGEKRKHPSPTKTTIGEAITVPPSRNNIQLSLSKGLDDGILIDTQPQCSKQEIPDILRSTNVIDIPLDDDSLKNSSENPLDISTDDGSLSDRTIKDSGDMLDVSNDSISSENNASYLKSLIADAIQSDCSSSHNDGLSSENLSMIQLEMPPRESSPLSSDKSDMVKIGSDHFSTHTSGDELETNTSSDIEIIPSPNGDSSSTQSRQSPGKHTYQKLSKDECQVDALLCKMALKNAKGHTRELSEASSISDDSHSPEIDKLIRKITEMTEILESRESKIVEINRKNAELQELNMELKCHLNSILSKQLESQDLTQVTEDYAQRMSALEKKFQQAIREKDDLRKQLEHVKQDSAMRLSKGELDTIIAEKDEMIKQLREEGEKLSKQQLQHSNIIKKLRAKEKENETTIKQLKEELESLTTESDRLKRTVNAKEDVERTQIEAVNQLTTKNKKFETELAKTKSELEDQLQKYDTLKKSLDAARKELGDKNRITNQLSAKEQMLESLENEKKVAESQNEEVISQLQYLRMKLHEYEYDYLEKERILKRDNHELLKRLESAESRNEELSQSVLEVSKPLVRQLESLQASHNLKMAHFEKLELDLTSKITEIQFRLTSALNNERMSKEECIELRSKLAKLEVDFNSVKHQKELLEVKFEQLKTERAISEQELKGKLEDLQCNFKVKCDEIEALIRENTTIRNNFEKELLQASHKDSSDSTLKHEVIDNLDETNSNPRSTSPTLSVGKASITDSLASSVWSQLESFDVGHPPRFANIVEIQMLQTNLQQREGELQQLQWELNRREQERNLINSELTTLTCKVDDLTNNLADYEVVKNKFEELQQQYDVLCQMYGEKVDEVEELRLDLLEAKEAYKSQLDELLRNQSNLGS